MPELFEIIESTRAMRRLKPDPVPDELVQKILRGSIKDTDDAAAWLARNPAAPPRAYTGAGRPIY